MTQTRLEEAIETTLPAGHRALLSSSVVSAAECTLACVALKFSEPVRAFDSHNETEENERDLQPGERLTLASPFIVPEGRHTIGHLILSWRRICPINLQLSAARGTTAQSSDDPAVCGLAPSPRTPSEQRLEWPLPTSALGGVVLLVGMLMLLSDNGSSNSCSVHRINHMQLLGGCLSLK